MMETDGDVDVEEFSMHKAANPDAEFSWLLSCQYLGKAVNVLQELRHQPYSFRV